MKQRCRIAADDLEAMWHCFSNRLRSFIRSRVSDDETAEDILQEVFIRIHAHAGSLRDKSKLESWIYRIARNAVIDHYRSSRQSVGLAELDIPDEEDADEEEAVRKLAPSVRELVEGLPEPYREALILTAYEGMSQRELADFQKISFSGAKSRVQRARQKVLDMLLTCCHFELDSRGRILDFYEHCCCCAGE